jgi:hypothetical protein
MRDEEGSLFTTSRRGSRRLHDLPVVVEIFVTGKTVVANLNKGCQLCLEDFVGIKRNVVGDGRSPPPPIPNLSFPTLYSLARFEANIHGSNEEDVA